MIGQVSESVNLLKLKEFITKQDHGLQDTLTHTLQQDLELTICWTIWIWKLFTMDTFVLQPIYSDLLRIQAIEFNDQIRKSAYSFEIRNNNMRIFPIPTESSSIYVDYVLTEDRDNPLRTRYSGSSDDTVSDYSNVNYDFMVYSNINDVGKQWIRKYTLALSKELLGIIRSKYGNIPIPNAEVSLDGDTLRAEATAEKEQLIEQLRENLEQTSRKALMEAQKDESDFQQETLRKVPYPIYIG